jgi:hypothetical protein
MELEGTLPGGEMQPQFRAGAAAIEVTPQDSQFLFGYPHVQRHSAGVHDPLWASALFLDDGRSRAIFIGVDIIFVSKDSAARIRRRICEATAVPADHVMVAATHTHSGPTTVDYVSCAADPVVPPTDQRYVRFLEDRIVRAAERAVAEAQPAEAGLAVAAVTGLGTNRRDPAGPSDPQVPVFLVRSTATQKPIACMLVCSMHPTVLHEDSKLVSADFPGQARLYLQQHALGADCPVVYHTGPAGNQSPRHVVRSQTFAEAARLGEILGRAVEQVLPAISFRSDLPIRCLTDHVELPRRAFPSVPDAEKRLDRAVRRFEELRRGGAPRVEVRTAECDFFGAEETLTLARAAQDGRLDAAAHSCLPAEVQVFRVGPWAFVGWPGECFVEYALEVKARDPSAFIISLANGEFQGYIVTEEAAAEGGYEASNALFDGPRSGRLLVETALKLLAKSR